MTFRRKRYDRYDEPFISEQAEIRAIAREATDNERASVESIKSYDDEQYHKSDRKDPDVDMLGGIQLLKLELELQNTWRHIDWGPVNKRYEKMECESHHCQDDWFSKSPSICRSYEGSKDELQNDSKNSLIKSLLKSSRSDVASYRDHSCRNSKFNRLFSKNGVHSCRSQNKLKIDVNPLEHLLYGNIQENWANITEAIKLLILFKKDRLMSSQTKQYYYQDSLFERGHPYLSSRDDDENTPFLYAGRRLLKEKAFRKALTLSELFIQAGSDVNAANVEGRTLLTYSVQYFDDSFELTRLLINSGATVWPLNSEIISYSYNNNNHHHHSNNNNNNNGTHFAGNNNNNIATQNYNIINNNNNSYSHNNNSSGVDRCGNQITNQFQSQPKLPDVTNVFRLEKNKKEVLYFGPQIRESGGGFEKNSAFTWFLRSIIRCRRLNPNAEKTLAVLCEIMGENPERMHSHVMRTMFRHAKCFKVLGPVFYQLKSCMMPYWRQPKDLKYLCRKEIRRMLGPTRLRSGINKLQLPNKMVDYILLE